MSTAKQLSQLTESLVNVAQKSQNNFNAIMEYIQTLNKWLISELEQTNAKLDQLQDQVISVQVQHDEILEKLASKCAKAPQTKIKSNSSKRGGIVSFDAPAQPEPAPASQTSQLPDESAISAPLT